MAEMSTEIAEVAQDLSDELSRPHVDVPGDVLVQILRALERIEARLDGTWVQGPNPL